MLNIHLIYVSSLETGDVEISRKIHTSFIGAVEDIDNVIQKYITDKKLENNFKILSKEEFDNKKLIKDTSLLAGGYCFRKKKSSVNIYKKIVIEGKLWNGYKIEKIGKMGIISDISIPVDNKLLQFVQSDNLKEVKDELVINLDQPKPSNYEHGKHVSFIQELKDRLDKRRNSIMNIEVPEKSEIVENKFAKSLTESKNNLKHVTPPPSPNFGLGDRRAHV